MCARRGLCTWTGACKCVLLNVCACVFVSVCVCVFATIFLVCGPSKFSTYCVAPLSAAALHIYKRERCVHSPLLTISQSPTQKVSRDKCSEAISDSHSSHETQTYHQGLLLCLAALDKTVSKRQLSVPAAHL